jgi:hypothetical protein
LDELDETSAHLFSQALLDEVSTGKAIMTLAPGPRNVLDELVL